MLYLNGQPLTVTIFPDKTSQVWKLPESIFTDCQKNRRPVIITWRFDSEGELIHLAQLKMLLQSRGIRASLDLPYLPYGRQDKEISNTSTFALRAFAHSINALSFEDVTICDPHSETALELIRFSHDYYPKDQLEEVILDTKTTLVCYPDKGALNKYSKLYNYPYIHGEKVRDQLTGNITSYKVVGDPAGKNVLIVDDICDGGMTFKLLAKDLLAAGAKGVVLFATHGIFSKGLKTLFDSGIQRVFTQDGEASEHEGQIMYRRL